MRTGKNKTKRLDAPGDNWPVLDLELLDRATRESVLLAGFRLKRPRWMKFAEKKKCSDA
jgi:hypothetical protein